MADDRVARRVSRMHKWHELVERHGSEDGAVRVLMASPEWAMTYELYPGADGWDESRRTLALDLLIAADDPGLTVTDTASDATGDEPKGLVGGRPYRRTDYTEPGKLFARGKMTVEGIKARTELSNRRAFRIHRQFNVGAVVVDGEQVRPGAGYRWDPKALDDVPQSYTLIRA